MTVLDFVLCLILTAVTQNRELVKEFDSRRSNLANDDLKGHTSLGEWARGKGLIDLAEQEFESVLRVDPNHARAREKLGFRRENDGWVETDEFKTRRKYKSAVGAGLKLPDRKKLDELAAKDGYYRRAIEFVGWKENWIRALRTLDERTGLFKGSFAIEVEFAPATVGEIASGFGQNGTGSVEIDIDRVANYIKRVDEFEALKRGGGMKVMLPPLKLDSILAHELTHCFQNLIPTPWIAEGMACYATGDSYFYYYLNYFKAKVTPIEKSVTEKNLHYGRGMAFFEYFEQTYGADKVKKLFERLVKKEGVRAAAEELSGKSWNELSKEEARWTEKLMKRYTPD